MPFSFVFVQNLLDLEIQAPVVEGKSLLYVFMFGRYELEWFHPAQDYQATGDKYPRFHLCLLQFLDDPFDLGIGHLPHIGDVLDLPEGLGAGWPPAAPFW